jgi:hypothetical protein
MRKLITLLLLLITGGIVSAQTTTVSGVVTDTNSVAYAGARLTVNLVANGIVQSSLPSQTLSSTGAFAIRLTSTASIPQPGTTYQFVASFAGINPPAGTGPQTCTLSNQTVSGASQTINLTGCPAITTVTGGGGGFTPQINGTPLSSAGLNLQTSTTNVAGLACTPTLVSTINVIPCELSGTLAHASLPTLLSGDIPNNAANTSGTAGNLSGTPTLPNGTAATTQAPGDNTTKLATDAFVLANAITNPMTTIGDMIGGGTSGVPTRIVGGKTGQVPTATNGATPGFVSPGVADGNAAAHVTTTPYVVACDSSTAILDRVTTIVFDSGASVITAPDHTVTGCGNNMAFTLVNESGSTLTVNRGGTDTFNITGNVAKSIAATSFTIPDSGSATLNNGEAGIWNARVLQPASAISGLTIGFIPKAASATTITNSLCDEAVTTANTFTCANTAGAAFTGSSVKVGASPPALTGNGIGGTETTGQTGATSADMLAWNSTDHCPHGIYNNVDLGCVASSPRTACTNGELALSAGFGSTATVTAVAGIGYTCKWTLTSNGTGQAANPTITDTFVAANALPIGTMLCDMRMTGGTGTTTLIDETTVSATAPVFTFGGTPVAASTYIVFRRCGE